MYMSHVTCRAITVSNLSEVLMSEGKAQLWTIGGMNGWKDLLCLNSIETAATALKDVSSLIWCHCNYENMA